MIGEIVSSYRIISKLGEGGMGMVFLAEHPLLRRKAAVKTLLPQYSQNKDIVARFFNEARAANLIKHPGIVDVIDVGYVRGCAFILMELLEGESLAAALRREGVLQLEVLLEVTRQLAVALGAAHARGIVHRDLKPDNIFLVPMLDAPLGLRVKVLDFGVAKLTEDSSGTQVKTRTNAMLGTPAYMSPEQCRGAGYVDHRTDIYAVGCILFEMACGRLPFIGEGPGDIMAAHMRDPPPEPRALAPSLPPVIQTVILRALAKDPGTRYQTMAELRLDLGALPAATQNTIAPLSTQIAIATAGDEGNASSTAEAPRPTTATLRDPTRPAGPDETTATVPPLGEPEHAPVRAASTTLSQAATQLHPRLRSTSSWRWLVALLAMGSLTGILVIALWPTAPPSILLTSAPPQQTIRAVPSLPVLPPVISSDAAATAPVSDTITLSITSVPPGAEVLRADDGGYLGQTSFKLSMPRGDKRVALRFRLAGYQDYLIDQSAERSTTVAVTLEKLKSGKPATHAGTSSRKGTRRDLVNPFAP